MNSDIPVKSFKDKMFDECIRRLKRKSKVNLRYRTKSNPEEQLSLIITVINVNGRVDVVRYDDEERRATEYSLEYWHEQKIKAFIKNSVDGEEWDDEYVPKPQKDRWEELYRYLSVTRLPLMLRYNSYAVSPGELRRFFFYDADTDSFSLSAEGKDAVRDYYYLRDNVGAGVKIPSCAIRMTTFYHEEMTPPTVISSWQDASAIGLLKSYFGRHDILKLFEDAIDYSPVYVMSYSADYYECVREQVAKRDVAGAYLDYLRRESDGSETQDYMKATTQGSIRSLRQLSEYSKLILDDGTIYVFPSDGYGVASCYCMLNNIEYYSWEPNPIGEMAIRLGIITSQNPIYTQLDVYVAEYQQQREKESIPVHISRRDRVAIEKYYRDNKLGSQYEYLSKCVYVYLYCVKYYSLPAIPYQRYIVLDAAMTKIPATIRYGRLGFSHSDVRERYKSDFDELDIATRELKQPVYPADNMALYICKNQNATIVPLQKRPIIVCMCKESVEWYRDKYKDNKRMQRMILYLPSWSYPFRQETQYRQHKHYGDEMFIHQGPGYYFGYSYARRVKNDDYDTNLDYIMQDGMIIIPGRRVTPVSYVRLREEDRSQFFNAEYLPVYFVSSVILSSQIFSFYSPKSNIRPITVLQ